MKSKEIISCPVYVYFEYGKVQGCSSWRKKLVVKVRGAPAGLLEYYPLGIGLEGIEPCKGYK